MEDANVERLSLWRRTVKRDNRGRADSSQISNCNQRGAAVAMLAFVGNAVTKWQTGGPLLSKVGAAMLVFVLSAGFGGTATGFRYLTQFWYSEARYAGAKKDRMLRCGGVANVVSILLGVASFAGFFIGGALAYRAIAE